MIHIHFSAGIFQLIGWEGVYLTGVIHPFRHMIVPFLYSYLKHKPPHLLPKLVSLNSSSTMGDHIFKTKSHSEQSRKVSSAFNALFIFVRSEQFDNLFK